jgi:glycosyltransferase involved in cell wall biosynthesis
MKIGIDARCFARGKNTGVEEYTKRSLEAIFAHDQKNEYVLFFNAWKRVHIDFSWATQYPHVKIKRFSIPNKLLNLSLWLLHFPHLDRLCGGVDIFFMPNVNFCALSSRAHLFLTVHDLSFEHYKRTFSLKRRLWHYFVNPRALIKKSSRIFAVSEATRCDLVRTYAILPKCITVIANGAPSVTGTLDRNDEQLISVKEKYSLPYKFILYFGTIEPRKNISGVVAMYNALRKKNHQVTHKLVIAGSRGWKAAEIYAAIDASPYFRDIIIITDVPEEDKEAIYALASVFIYPSFFEGFGFPPLEALTCHVPVIMSHTTSLPEVVGRHAIMIDPYRIEEGVRALESIIIDKTFATTLTQTAIEHYRTFQSWRTAAEQFLDKCNTVA